MKERFETAEELQAAHELLAMVQYLFLNRQNQSQFVCITILSVYIGEHDETPLDWDAHDLRKLVGRKLEKAIQERIYPYSTVETFLAQRDENEVMSSDIDPEVARDFRLNMLEELLKELA